MNLFKTKSIKILFTFYLALSWPVGEEWKENNVYSKANCFDKISLGRIWALVVKSYIRLYRNLA